MMRANGSLRRIERLWSQALRGGHKGKARVWAAMMDRRREKVAGRADPALEPQGDTLLAVASEQPGAVPAAEEPAHEGLADHRF